MQQPASPGRHVRGRSGNMEYNNKERTMRTLRYLLITIILAVLAA